MSGIKKSLNHEKIISFISYGFKSLFLNEETFFCKIKAISSSTALNIDKNLEINKKKFGHKNQLLILKTFHTNLEKKNLKIC